MGSSLPEARVIAGVAEVPGMERTYSPDPFEAPQRHPTMNADTKAR